MVDETASVTVADGALAPSSIILPKPDQLIVAIPSMSKSREASFTTHPVILYTVLLPELAPLTESKSLQYLNWFCLS